MQRCYSFVALLTTIAGLCLVPHPYSSYAASLFDGEADVGRPANPGTLQYDPGSETYRVAGGGANMWSTNDAFHFVYKKVSGDLALAANIGFVGNPGNPHSKACLIVRQSLDADSAYADAALHADGLTSLQFRETKGDVTHEVQANVKAQRGLRLEKRGQYFTMSIADENELLHPASGSPRLLIQDPFYIGLAVCAHDDKALETAIFSKVRFSQTPPAKTSLVSMLEIIPLGSKDRRAIYCTTNRLEAPNWSRDNFLYYNSQGRVWKISTEGGEPQPIDTGFATRCNNDHGLSPDGMQLVISDHSQEKNSIIYTLPIRGGEPKRITPLGPSYWHGWSPDSKTLVYCAERNKEFDIYAIPATGGQEVRLTTAPGLDDGPEYSPDGKYIYFNSERTGTMQIWRMRPDGSQQEQVTNDGFNNWFAHPSPDGKWLVFLTYPADVKGHPENKDVMLRLMPTQGGAIQILAKLFGGQGTINVPSWSPDNRKLAFVSYAYFGMQP